jgi:phytoene synthase
MNDSDRCADITKRNARTFGLAANLLPRNKRRGVFALYAFCRQADDIVDRGVAGDRFARERLGTHRTALTRAFEGTGTDPVFRELAWTISEFRIPREPLLAVLDGVACDLQPSRYASWDALESYCVRVASSVGEMCTYVFGTQEPADMPVALYRARRLGLAMQLTNILRDVGEDARRGRCYLPEDELARFGFQRDDVLTDTQLAAHGPWRELMRFEIARARTLYSEAETGFPLLARDSQQCAIACARGYAAILNAIERQAYDTIRTRAVVPTWQKASVLWRAWMQTA